LAEKMNDKNILSKIGTPGYIAPEILNNHYCLDKSDIFSLGVVFYMVS